MKISANPKANDGIMWYNHCRMPGTKKILIKLTNKCEALESKVASVEKKAVSPVRTQEQDTDNQSLSVVHMVTNVLE